MVVLIEKWTLIARVVFVGPDKPEKVELYFGGEEVKGIKESEFNKNRRRHYKFIRQICENVEITFSDDFEGYEEFKIDMVKCPICDTEHEGEMLDKALNRIKGDG